MSDNVGLSTPRGSGTSGYVQRNLAAGLGGKKAADTYVKARIAMLQARVVDLQWNTLVQRVRDSGTLENAIAVVDVSGSMLSPTFADGTSPMDTAIALGLIVAQAARPPFANAFITFSSRPAVKKVDPAKGLAGMIETMSRADWSGTTDFHAVFEKLLLPMAVRNKLKPEDMVKRLFVFSDMGFNEAEKVRDNESFETSHQRIARKYAEAGYEMPEMVYWNIAGGRWGGERSVPKPVTRETDGTAMVSGYSQAMLKVFMENGTFKGEEDEVDEVDEVDEDEDLVEVEVLNDGDIVEKKQKTANVKRNVKRIDPLSIVKKVVNNDSYRMLKVVD